MESDRTLPPPLGPASPARLQVLLEGVEWEWESARVGERRRPSRQASCVPTGTAAATPEPSARVRCASRARWPSRPPGDMSRASGSRLEPALADGEASNLPVSPRISPHLRRSSRLEPALADGESGAEGTVWRGQVLRGVAQRAAGRRRAPSGAGQGQGRCIAAPAAAAATAAPESCSCKCLTCHSRSRRTVRSGSHFHCSVHSPVHTTAPAPPEPERKPSSKAHHSPPPSPGVGCSRGKAG